MAKFSFVTLSWELMLRVLGQKFFESTLSGFLAIKGYLYFFLISRNASSTLFRQLYITDAHWTLYEKQIQLSARHIKYSVWWLDLSFDMRGAIHGVSKKVPKGCSGKNGSYLNHGKNETFDSILTRMEIKMQRFHFELTKVCHFFALYFARDIYLW